MKKTYMKPVVVLESFFMSTHIAGDCESIVGNPAKETCAVLGTGGVAMFSGTVSACDYTPEDVGKEADKWDGFCYHVPTADKNLFNS